MDTFTSPSTQVLGDICHPALLLVTPLAAQIAGQSGPGCWVWDSVPASHVFAEQLSCFCCPIPSVPDTAALQALNSSGFSHDLMEKDPSTPCAKLPNSVPSLKHPL